MKLPVVINAAGKMTALGGSAQSATVAAAQQQAASTHVDLAELRQRCGAHIATLTHAEAGCVTTGAAAGIAIAVAAVVTGNDLTRVQKLPNPDERHPVLIQAGHVVNFGAPVEQMIRLGGGSPDILGSVNLVAERHLRERLATGPATALLYVQSHHCVQDNMLSLDQCIALCQEFSTPVIVDAAAEEDLTCYSDAGADLVIYSGGKAFSGPTVGFVCGKQSLVTACELQFQGIARAMKVGKEAIAGLAAALAQYVSLDPVAERANLAKKNQKLLTLLESVPNLTAGLQADEAGRLFERVRISLESGAIRELVTHLRNSTPPIHTRNHHLDQGYLLIDPRELNDDDVEAIAQRIASFCT